MSTKNVLVWINTFNRLQSFSELLADIDSQIGYNISVMVFNDHSDCKKEYEDIIEKYKECLNISYTYTDKNYGKHEYWKLYNQGLEKIKEDYKHIDYFFRLDDDLRLIGNDCFDKVINIWENINDPKKISLMPLHDERVNKNQWTGIPAKEIEFNNYKVMKIGWIDDIYFCTNKFFEVVNRIPTISKVRWIDRPQISTGTGQYATRVLIKKHSLYGIHLDDCLITHEFDLTKNPSVMNRGYDDLC